MTIDKFVRANRSCRRFDQSQSIAMQTLEELVGLTRYCASAMNKQPLRYALVNAPDQCAEVFEALAWAGYLKDWPGPAQGERPAAYVVIYNEGEPGPWSKADVGIAAQTILLGAVERGLGGCMLGALKKDVLQQALGVDEALVPMLVLALGTPAEKIVVDDMAPGGDYKYWRDDEDTHHVPKRTLNELIVLPDPQGR